MSTQPIQVDSATKHPWEHLGIRIIRSGNDDSSGLRRFLARCLAQRDFVTVERILGISTVECRALRRAFVDAFGEVDHATD